jgi:hypothetical protein
MILPCNLRLYFFHLLLISMLLMNFNDISENLNMILYYSVRQTNILQLDKLK